MKKVFWIVGIVFSSSFTTYDESKEGTASTFKTREAGINTYNIEIQQCEDSFSSKTHPIQKFLSLHIQRADLHFANKNYQAALKDYQKIISCIEDCRFFDPADVLEGLCGSLFCYLCLQKDELAKLEFDKLTYHASLMGDEVETIGWFKNSPVFPIYKKNIIGIKNPFN